MAKRVTLSIMHMTFLPWSRKYSAIDMVIEGLPPHQRRLVGCGDDDDAPRHAVLAQILGDELLHLAATFADQADDVDIDRHVARASIDISTDADAGTGDAHALTAQQDRKVFIARTPRSILPPTRRREWAGGGLLRIGMPTLPFSSGPLPSIGSPSALTTRPSQLHPGIPPADHPILPPCSRARRRHRGCPAASEVLAHCGSPRPTRDGRRRAIIVQRPPIDKSRSTPPTSTSKTQDGSHAPEVSILRMRAISLIKWLCWRRTM